MTEFVCAWCDVWNRVEHNQYDDQGRAIVCGTACAYCGRTRCASANWVGKRRFRRRGQIGLTGFHSKPENRAD
jgi:hypothetical protein